MGRNALVGIIGGTGLHNIGELEELDIMQVQTPYGSPSSPVILGTVGGVRVAFIARYGKHHTLLPGEINYRANIYAFKTLEVSWCISVGAVRSLHQDFAPHDVVVPDQIIDLTTGRIRTFFGNGIVVHVPRDNPFCPVLQRILVDASSEVCTANNVRSHGCSTYVCVEGPARSTQAESELFRSWGGGVIGMTSATESCLCREAEISYASLCLITDYSHRKAGDDEVAQTDRLKIMDDNAALSKEILTRAVPMVATAVQPDAIRNALTSAIITPLEKVSDARKNQLGPILSRYVD